MKNSVLCFMVLGVMGCASHRIGGFDQSLADKPRERQRFPYSVQKNVIYAERSSGLLRGDLYRPTDLPNVPAVLVVHGGGWVRGKREDMNKVCETIAQRGFAVFNISYRFAPAHPFPAQLEDVQEALQWMSTHAVEYGFDASRMGAFGYSAGAHLVSLLGVLGDDEPLTQKIVGKQKRAKLKAVVSGGTPADLTQFPDSKLVKKLMGFPLAGHQAEYEQASPIYHVSAGDPPFFLYHGGVDWVVDRSQMDRFASKLAEKAVTVETYSVPLLGHVALFVFSDEAIEVGVDFLSRYLYR